MRRLCFEQVVDERFINDKIENKLNYMYKEMEFGIYAI